jgi:hypothetical protein
MKKLVLRALTDPKFRKMLNENPMEAAEMYDIKGGVQVINRVLATTNFVDNQIHDITDYILCTEPPVSCGIC